jgi:hypothetical protein
MLSYDLGVIPTPVSALPELSLTLSSLCVTIRACMPSGRERGMGPNKATEKTLSIFLYIPYTLDPFRLRECLMIYRELQAFSRSYDLAPRQPPPPLSRQKARPAKRQIIRLQESLILYKSFNTLWTPSSPAFHARVLCSDSMIILS